MAYRDLHMPVPGIETLYERVLGELCERLDDPSTDRNALCRETLARFYGLTVPPDEAWNDERLPLATRTQYAAFDPRNITLEPEYYSDMDPERYYRVKPLLWLWIMFDRSPQGENAYLGHRFRRILAERIFRRCGKNVKIWHNVELTYGYNLSVGDNVVLHRYVFVDDRGEVIIGDHASVSDYVNIYSHSHDINDISKVTLGRTVIGPHARITYHATILSGTTVGKDAMVGAMALATKDAPASYVSLGIPARPVRPKDRPCPYCEVERKA